jgi:uncharacterized protein (TIGR03790 family)
LRRHRKNENFELVGLFMLRCIKLFVLCLLCSGSSLCYALDPDEVLVVANTEMAGSVDLAKYYMKKREIPVSHLLSLSLSLDETMTRQEYDDVLVKAVLQSLEKLKPTSRIAAIVLIYGVPLKVAPPLPGRDTLDRIREQREKREALATTSEEHVPEVTRLRKDLGESIRTLLNTNQRAAVDSELSLVKAGQYNLDGWIKNPYYLGFQGQDFIATKNQVLLVCRLDGPDEKTVYRLIDDSLWAEENGLQGRAYFDARWPKPLESEVLDGYRLYDNFLHEAAKIARQKMEVVLDETGGLFPEAACPDAALYCGWYSLSKYIDSFEWQRGAVGYHIASNECSTLRKKESSVWCLKMLEKGVAATIGPVYEPYVQGFPVPHVFFYQLLEGYMSLGESYLVSLPYLSWQMVLIGDPLYQPFEPAEPEVLEKNGP